MFAAEHFGRMLPRPIRQKVKAERGTTLIEMMVVISIISIVSVGVVYLFTALFNSTAQAQSAQNQQGTVNNVEQFVQTRIYGVGLGDGQVGLLNPEGKVDAASIAGDQFFLSDGDHCLRMMYGHRTGLQGLFVASGTGGACEELETVRGPNLQVWEECTDECFMVSNPADQFFDKALDEPTAVGSFPLVPGASLPAGSSRAFTFLDEQQNEIAGIAQDAGFGGTDDNAALLARVKYIRISISLPGLTTTQGMGAPKTYTKLISLG